MKASIVLAVLPLMLAGCTLFDSPKDRAMRNNPSFKEGYEDGCAAATNQGSDLRDRPVGDKDLYAADSVYRAGFGNGFETCRRTNLSPGASPGDNPVSLPGPGGP